MSRAFKNFVFLLLGLVLGGMASWASAASVPAWWVPRTNPAATPVQDCTTLCAALKPGSICYSGGGYDFDTCTIGGATGTPVVNVDRLGCPAATPVLDTTPVPNTCHAACTGGAVWNSATQACESTNPCTAKTGTSAGTGYLKIGGPGSVSIGCDGSCEYQVVSASDGHRSLVDGVVQEWAKGSWVYSGAACSGAANTAVASLPADTCASGQGYAVYNGKKVCYSTTTGEVLAKVAGPPSESSSISRVDNGNGTSTITNTTYNNETNQTTTTTTVVNNVTGQPISETKVADKPSDKPGDMESFCQDNPGLDICKTTESGAGVAVSGLYTPAPAKTFADALNAFKASAQAAPIISAANAFFNVSTLAGNCSALIIDVPLWTTTYTINLAQYLCGADASVWYGYLALGLLLAATVAAFWIAIL